MNPEIEQKYLPVECYSSASNNLVPRRLEQPTGIVQHYFSCINVKPNNPYDLDLCWMLMRDLNFDQELRVYDIYTGPRAPASAHFLIGHDGRILQLVPEEYQAWHAGKSQFKGRDNCNQFMFGIENVGSYGVVYPEAQYKANADLCRYLMKKYSIPIENITGHENVASGRKKDPGPTFMWEYLRSKINSI